MRLYWLTWQEMSEEPNPSGKEQMSWIENAFAFYCQINAEGDKLLKSLRISPYGQRRYQRPTQDTHPKRKFIRHNKSNHSSTFCLQHYHTSKKIKQYS